MIDWAPKREMCLSESEALASYTPMLSDGVQGAGGTEVKGNKEG